MNIKSELSKLKHNDIWSLVLFSLYNFQKIPEYSSISELCYVLDQKNLLRLCEYFGGSTIKIPTIDELEVTLYALLLYQYINIESISESRAIELLAVDKSKEKDVKDRYKQLINILDSYKFVSRNNV